MANARILLTLIAIMLSGCTQAGDDRSPGTAADATFEDVYAAAEQALAAAQEARNVWSKTEALLRQSQAAYGEGRVDVAIELATEARLQAELALAQALTEKDAWRSRVLSN